MTQKRRLVITVVCMVVALAGIGLLTFFFRLHKATVLAAHTKITPSPSMPQMTATLEVFTDPVTILLPGQVASVAAQTGMTIPEGTIVTTGTTGRAQIKYPGGTVTRLDHVTEIKLTTYNPQPARIAIDIFQGKTWSRIKKLLGNESYETKTSNTVATVRGTSYEHSVLDTNEDQVTVLEGKVAFGCSKNKDIETHVDANKKALVDCATDIVIDPVPVSAEDKQTEWVQFNNRPTKNMPTVIKPHQTATPAEPIQKHTPPASSSRKKDLPSAVRPTDRSGVESIVSPAQNIIPTVVIPTLPSIINTRDTSTPIPVATPTTPPTHKNDAKAEVNVGGILDVGVGLGSSGTKLNLHLGR